jgi:glucokinase
MLEAGGFRHGFESKGRYRDFLESVPTYVITHEQPGLMGAAIAARIQSGAEPAPPVQP